MCTLFAELMWALPRIFRSLKNWNTQKNPFLNQATQKILAKFSSQKNPAIEISNPKRSFDQPHHLKSGVPHWGNI